MWKIIFIIQKPESMLMDLQPRKMLRTSLITISPSLDCISNEHIEKIHIPFISPSLDCISNERIEKIHIPLLAHVPLMRTSHWSKLSSYQKCESRFELLMLINICLSILKVVWNRQPMANQYWSTKSKCKFCTLWKSVFLNPPRRKNCKPKCDWCTFYFLAPYVGSL